MWFVCFILIFSFCFTESSKEQFAYTNIAEELVKLFKKQIEHDKKEMIFEVLAPLAENGENFSLLLCLLLILLCIFFISVYWCVFQALNAEQRAVSFQIHHS